MLQRRVYYDVLPFFFFNDTATTEIYTLSLHDALPIFDGALDALAVVVPAEAALASEPAGRNEPALRGTGLPARFARSEEHTSELQSRLHLVCRLLLEKKKINIDLLWRHVDRRKYAAHT